MPRADSRVGDGRRAKRETALGFFLRWFGCPTFWWRSISIGRSTKVWLTSRFARLSTPALITARYFAASTSRMLTVTLARWIFLHSSPQIFQVKRDCSQSTLLYITLLYPTLSIFHRPYMHYPVFPALPPWLQLWNKKRGCPWSLRSTMALKMTHFGIV